jgi:hypothetical protein
MAGRGPLPKAHRQRERDERRRQREFTTYERDGSVYGPSLPEATHRAASEFHPATVEWWEAWRRVPWARDFEPTDWTTLARIAPLVDTISRGTATAAAATEVRLTESALGATFGDRRRMRVAVGASSNGDTPAGATGTEDLRARMAGRPA